MRNRDADAAPQCPCLSSSFRRAIPRLSEPVRGIVTLGHADGFGMCAVSLCTETAVFARCVIVVGVHHRSYAMTRRQGRPTKTCPAAPHNNSRKMTSSLEKVTIVGSGNWFVRVKSASLLCAP